MTRQGWAERKVRSTHARPGADVDEQLTELCVRLLLAEHRLAVRVVKRQLDLYQRQREVEKDEHRRDLLAGSIFACVDLLESLQRGRE